MTFRVFTLSSILLRGEEVWNSLTKGSLNLSKGVFERRTSTRSRAEIGLSSVTLSSTDTTKFVINCQVPLLLWRRFSLKFKRNHFPRMQKVHFRLTCIAHKRVCLKLDHLCPVISLCTSLLCLIIEMLLLFTRRQGWAYILAENKEQLIARSTFMTKLILKA